ncbi:MAG: MFS transporter [Blastocatellia bacterium]|jgi:FSR family fosmidomycin resistance protein-like MFS transporter
MNRNQKLTIGLLSATHLVLDSYSSFLFQLLPILTINLQLSPTGVAWLSPALMISSSLMQPVYGMISDRYLKRAMAVYGPLIAAIFFSLLGLATDLPTLFLLVVLGGIGVGAFHPQGAAMVSRAVQSSGLERRQGLVMSIFSSAGTVGYALGPLIIAIAVSLFGLARSWVTIFPGLLISIVMWRYCPPLEIRQPHPDQPPLSSALRRVLVPLTLLYFAVVFRSAVSVSIQTFLPFQLQSSGLSDGERSLVLAGFIFFGGVGGFFGGSLADRFGARRVTITAMLLAPPLLILALLSPGWQGYLLLMAGGTMLNLPIPISVVMAQRLVGFGASTVSALMMGFAWGAGAMLAPLTGELTDSIGFTSALVAISFLPLVSALLLWFYPDGRRAELILSHGD